MLKNGIIDIIGKITFMFLFPLALCPRLEAAIMNPTSRATKILFILIAGLMLVTACQPEAAPTEPPAPVTESSSSSAASSGATDNATAINQNILLDPALAEDADSMMLNQYLYEGLVTLDASGSPQPALAESWVVSDDGLAYTFVIRSNAAFSDGTPVTPDDVVNNVTRWLDPASPLRGTGQYAYWEEYFLGFLDEKDADGRPVSPVDGVQKVDFNTVIIHLNRPVPDLLTLLANPAFAIIKTDALAAGNYGTQNSTIISSGPYMVTAWTDTGLTLSPNPSYWGSAAQVELEFTWR